MLRLDKYLADMGKGTRSEVKKIIIKGMVTVDGLTIKKPEYKVNPLESEVVFQGIGVEYAITEYYMLNKPKGVVSATSDKKDQTVLDLIESKKRKDLFPVGRLDKDTEGLLLITNDGALSHRLLSPKNHVDKVYEATINGCVTRKDIEQFKEGVQIGEGYITKPSKLEVIEGGEVSKIKLTIQEGKFHQVKQMFEGVEKEVIYLKRISMGRLKLDETLQPGEYRPLTKEEMESLC